MAALGPELYQKIYEFLKYNRRKGTNEEYMHSKIIEIVHGDRRLLSLCFELDTVVYQELL